MKDKSKKIEKYFVAWCDLSAILTNLNTLKKQYQVSFDEELLSMIEEARIIVERAERHAMGKIQKL